MYIVVHIKTNTLNSKTSLWPRLVFCFMTTSCLNQQILYCSLCSIKQVCGTSSGFALPRTGLRNLKRVCGATTRSVYGAIPTTPKVSSISEKQKYFKTCVRNVSFPCSVFQCFILCLLKFCALWLFISSKNSLPMFSLFIFHVRSDGFLSFSLFPL